MYKTIKKPTAIEPKQINRHFLIRWKYYDDPKAFKGYLIGAGRYAEKFGERYKDLHFEKVMESGEQKTTFKIRGNYEITFFAR